ncbi:MAG: hypothetical protein FWD36_03220 [Treponema sp.]|nr:hypothetical protein [Treponema sp.]
MIKENILRGKLLDLLWKVYPDGIDIKSVVSILFQYHRVDDILTSLEYLTDKKYILMKEHPDPVVKQEKFKWYKLTPHGIDLLESNIPDDPGIIIPRG